MNSPEVYGVNPSDDTIIITPVEDIAYVYQPTQYGDDLICLYFTDAKVGEIFIPLTTVTAADISAHITTMLAQLPALRAQHQQRDGDKE